MGKKMDVDPDAEDEADEYSSDQDDWYDDGWGQEDWDEENARNDFLFLLDQISKGLPFNPGLLHQYKDKPDWQKQILEAFCLRLLNKKEE